MLGSEVLPLLLHTSPYCFPYQSICSQIFIHTQSGGKGGIREGGGEGRKGEREEEGGGGGRGREKGRGEGEEKERQRKEREKNNYSICERGYCTMGGPRDPPRDPRDMLVKMPPASSTTLPMSVLALL